MTFKKQKIYFLSTDGMSLVTEIYQDEVGDVIFDDEMGLCIITDAYGSLLPISEFGTTWAYDAAVLEPEKIRMNDCCGLIAVDMSSYENEGE